MNAFISYSHNDATMLDLLHKHLAQLQRDGIISTWTDREISAGANLEYTISSELLNSEIFMALLSPDYIASNYCYEKEFKTALEMQDKGQIIILPVIVESCDWLSTPFSKFKALPKDGKAVSVWENANTAFLDVIQNIRNLILSKPINISNSEQVKALDSIPATRNYRVKKDFDTIEKIDFVENTFNEVKEYLKRYVGEITRLDNIKAIVSDDKNNNFECIVVNRNKIATEAHLQLTTTHNKSAFHNFLTSEKHLSYAINQNMMPHQQSFVLNFDDYHLFWAVNNFSSNHNKELSSKEMADFIWEECLEKAGIV